MEVTVTSPKHWRWTTATCVTTQNVPTAGTFNEFIDTLPEWEQELLSHTQMTTDAFAVGVALEHGIRAVSDGSEWFKTQGSFGWMLSSDLGERLASGMGPASGQRPNSYRSEGYGMLALLCFLHRLAEYINLHEPWHGIIATDSKSLVDTVRGKVRPELNNQTTKVPWRRPLDPLSSEWDVVVVGIQHLLNEMPGLKMEHIKGHQDSHRDYGHLSLLAQLNVDADAIANQYQRDHGTHRPNVALTRWAGAHLVFPTGTVTSHYESSLRYQATAEPMRNHLRERNKWSLDVMTTINWKSHGTSIRNHMNKRTHVIKLVNGILPTNAKLHRNDNIRNRRPKCRLEKEDWEHTIRCDTPERNEWRTRMLKAVDDKCVTLKTHPELRALLVQSIRQWLQWTPKDPDDQFTIKPDLHDSVIMTRLIVRQNGIGWKHILLGRFSTDWSEIQDDQYASMLNTKGNKRRTGQRWQTAIIGELWNQWFMLWEMRNSDLHGATESSRARAEREEVERSFREIYDMREQMEPSVQQLLCQDITNHFAKPLWFNKNWIAIHGPLVRKSVKTAKKKAIQGVRSIRQYFNQR